MNTNELRCPKCETSDIVIYQHTYGTRAHCLSCGTVLADEPLHTEPKVGQSTASGPPPLTFGGEPNQEAAHMRLVKTLRDKFTLAQKITEEGEPELYSVGLKVGVQSFKLSCDQDSREAAEWMRLMLGKALANIVLANIPAIRGAVEVDAPKVSEGRLTGCPPTHH